MSPNSSSVHPKDGAPLTAWTGCEMSPNSSSVHLKDKGPLTAWMGCKAPLNSSSVHPKDGGPSLPGQGERAPKLLTAWTGCEAPPNSSSVHPKGSFPPPSLDRLERNLGEDGEGFAGTKSRDRPWSPEGGWSPPLRQAGLQQALH